MLHPDEHKHSCPKNGLMGEWWKAEKWESCASEDFKAMYQYFIKKKGLDWCLTSNFVGFEGKGTLGIQRL